MTKLPENWNESLQKHLLQTLDEKLDEQMQDQETMAALHNMMKLVGFQVHWESPDEEFRVTTRDLFRFAMLVAGLTSADAWSQ